MKFQQISGSWKVKNFEWGRTKETMALNMKWRQEQKCQPRCPNFGKEWTEIWWKMGVRSETNTGRGINWRSARTLLLPSSIANKTGRGTLQLIWKRKEYSTNNTGATGYSYREKQRNSIQPQTYKSMSDVIKTKTW